MKSIYLSHSTCGAAEGAAAPPALLPIARETPARLVVIRALPISEAFVLASETDQAGRRQGVR